MEMCIIVTIMDSWVLLNPTQLELAKAGKTGHRIGHLILYIVEHFIMNIILCSKKLLPAYLIYNNTGSKIIPENVLGLTV